MQYKMAKPQEMSDQKETLMFSFKKVFKNKILVC